MGDAFVTIAKIVKPQGRLGEVAADLHTDFPERFAERTRLYAVAPSGERRELQLEDFWPHKGRIVLKFKGVDSITAAEELKGWEVQIPATERAKLEAGAVYVSDLVGCDVIADGRELGKVADVDFGAGAAPLLVVRQGKKEYLLPFAEEFVQELNLANKRVQMTLPQGMLDLDAPLSQQERERQQKKDGA